MDCFIKDYEVSYWPGRVIAGCDLILKSSLSQEKEAEVRINRGLAFRFDGDLSKSRMELEKAADLDPNNAFGWRMLGWTYQELGEYQLADDVLTEAIKTDPEDWQGYLSRCVVRGYRLSAYEAAVEDCEKVIDLGNVTYDSVYLLAYSYNTLGRFDDAIKQIESYAESAVISEQLYEEYITALSGAGRSEEAWQIAKAAVYNYPDSDVLKRMLRGLESR